MIGEVVEGMVGGAVGEVGVAEVVRVAIENVVVASRSRSLSSRCRSNERDSCI